jgi:N-acetylglucosamine kinase-like BadF-type ATPase
MFIIVDSGSTKSDWVILDSEYNQTFESTMGFNPYFHDERTIVSAIQENQGIMKNAEKIQAIYFYGAGCSGETLNSIVRNALSVVFFHAKVYVDHDLTACAYATYQGKPAISCIIGTGSNSCFFDGESISEEVPALGYVLGDEGSGSYFGKQLLSQFLYKKMPKHIEADFRKEYDLTKDKIIDKIYMSPNANVYLASFSRFISKHHTEPYFKKMVFDGMKKFLEFHVCCYPNHKEVEVHFIGSIAQVFSEELKNAAADFDINIGQIIQKPIGGLVKYHLNHFFLSNSQQTV